jgi:hypothetical protein
MSLLDSKANGIFLDPENRTYDIEKTKGGKGKKSILIPTAHNMQVYEMGPPFRLG